VEILLCEGVDVERRVKPRNISWYLRLDLSFNSQIFISCIVIIAHTYTY